MKPSILARARPSDASRTFGLALDHELAVLARLKRRAEDAVEHESASESFIPSQDLDPSVRLRNCAGFAGTAT